MVLCGLVLFNCKSAEYEFNISNFVHLKKANKNSNKIIEENL